MIALLLYRTVTDHLCSLGHGARNPDAGAHRSTCPSRWFIRPATSSSRRSRPSSTASAGASARSASPACSAPGGADCTEFHLEPAPTMEPHDDRRIHLPSPRASCRRNLQRRRRSRFHVWRQRVRVTVQPARSAAARDRPVPDRLHRTRRLACLTRLRGKAAGAAWSWSATRPGRSAASRCCSRARCRRTLPASSWSWRRRSRPACLPNCNMWDCAGAGVCWPREVLPLPGRRPA